MELALTILLIVNTLWYRWAQRILVAQPKVFWPHFARISETGAILLIFVPVVFFALIVIAAFLWTSVGWPVLGLTIAALIFFYQRPDLDHTF